MISLKAEKFNGGDAKTTFTQKSLTPGALF
jgi:hypothetical protein